MTDTTLQQDDLMTELLAAHPQVGRLMWFTVDDAPVDQAQWLQAMVQAGLTTYGTPTGLAPSTAFLRGLHAMKRATADRTLLRRVIREKGRTVHHWIEEKVSNGVVDFRVLASIERDTQYDRVTTKRWDTLEPSEDAALSRLPEFIETAGRTYTPGDRRRQVRQWLGKVGALQMAAAGPVQFVPEEASSLIETLTHAQSDLGLHVWSMPLARSADVIGTLTQSLDAEVTKKTASLLEAINKTRQGGKTPTTGQQAKLVAQLHDLTTRVQHYSNIFGEQLDNLTGQIDLAKRAVRGVLDA